MLSGARRLRGLYVITDPVLTPPARLPELVEAALAGGARLVQLRDKQAQAGASHAQAAVLAALCRRHGATFIVNDDVELARACGAHGVHLGREDAPLAAAREALGPAAIIGVSCYDSLARARSAAQQGADYVAFGSFFASPTKPQAVRAPLALLAEARAELELPVCAIGGITAANGGTLLAAGADMLAVISEVFAAADAGAAARALSALFR